MPIAKVETPSSGGGAGGYTYGAAADGGDGGSGGVAVYLEVDGNVDINQTINLDGQAGTNGEGGAYCGGGGGGGGGWIVLWAPTITITGSLTKSGGSAGSTGSPSAGSTGQDLQITSAPIFEFSQGAA